MVTVSATKRPQGEGEEGRPQLILPDETQGPSAAGRGVAGRRHQTWASRFENGQRGEADQQRFAVGPGAGWEVFSYLIAGMLTYGGLGWVIGHFTHIQLLFPIGMLVGLAISLGWIIHRYGRQ
jgi:ATP synthase protein I